MDSDEYDILIAMHNNQWPDLILSTEYNSVLVNVLTAKERMVCELKVQLYEEEYPEKEANKYIAKLMKLTVSAVERYIYSIKSKYRHKMDTRVDNKLRPYWIYKNAIRKGKGTRKGYFRKNV